MRTAGGVALEGGLKGEVGFSGPSLLWLVPPKRLPQRQHKVKRDKNLKRWVSLLELAADLGELHQAGLHGQRQLPGRDHQPAVLIRVVSHGDAQGPRTQHLT